MSTRLNSYGQLRALREAAHALSVALEERQVIQILLDQTFAIVEVRGVLVRTLDRDGDELLLVGARGLSEAYLQKGIVRLAESEVDQRVLSGEVINVPDVTREAGFQYPEAAVQEGLRRMLAVSLSIRDRHIGVLRVYLNDGGDLSQEEIESIRVLADMCALALEKIRLHQSLYRIAETLNSSLELKPLLMQVLEATVNEMGLKAASIRLLDPRQQILHLMAAFGLSEAYLAKGEIHVDKSPVDQRVLQGEAVVLSDVKGQSGLEYPHEVQQEGIHSVLVVPVKLKARNLGIMRAYSARERHFGPVAIDFLESIADLVALAIENSELYKALQSRYEDLKLDLAEWYRFLALG